MLNKSYNINSSLIPGQSTNSKTFIGISGTPVQPWPKPGRIVTPTNAVVLIFARDDLPAHELIGFSSCACTVRNWVLVTMRTPNHIKIKHSLANRFRSSNWGRGAGGNVMSA